MKMILVIFLIFFNISCFSKESLIQERITFFKKSEKSLTKISKLLITKNYEEIINEARIINDWSILIPSFFPEGTQATITNDSDASSDIWMNFDDFTKKAKKTEYYSLQIINSALKNNFDGIKIALNKTSASCTSCHRSFRN